jgi:hypothetical protein
MKTICNQCALTLRVEQSDKARYGERVTCSDCKQGLRLVVPHDNSAVKVYGTVGWKQPVAQPMYPRYTPYEPQMIDLAGDPNDVTDKQLLKYAAQTERLLSKLNARIWYLRWARKKVS